MRLTKRILSMLLCVVMVVGMIPATTLTALAAGETTYVLSGSDFQARSGHDAGAQIVSGILDQIDNTYPTMDGFLFAGDYDVNYASSASGKTKLQQTVQGVYGTGMHEVYTEGNHDDNGDGSWSASGNNDADAYGVFVINEDDYMWYNDNEARIRQTANNLEAYLNAKRNAQYTKPIFVISHLPLHYCMRTREGGNDGMHANYIFDVLNEAGNAGLNIIFLFGHNHSHGWDDYLGGAAIYLKKGDKINIAQNSTTVFQEETLAFTYMNPGYVGYYGDSYTSDVDKTLTMSVFEITDDEVKVSRYDSNGLHNMKSAGEYNVEYPDSAYYSTNETVYTSPQTITLNKTITPAGEEIEIPTTPGTGGGTTTERTYTRVTSTSDLVSGEQYLIIENSSTDYFMLPESISNSAGDRVGYNIESTTVAGGDTITGDYSAKEWTLTQSGSGWVLGTDSGNAYMAYQSSSRGYGRISTTNRSVFTIGGSEDDFTFATTTNNTTYVFDHSSAGMINGYVKTPDTTFYIYRLTDEGGSGTVTGPTVDTEGGDWETITEPVKETPAVPGTPVTTYTYTQVTSITRNGKYVILAENDYVALMNKNGSKGTQTVSSSDGGSTITSTTALTEWTFGGTSSGTVRDISGSRYLRYSNGLALHRSQSTTWNFSRQSDGSYQISYHSGRTTYYINYSNGNFNATSSSENLRLYEYTSEKTETVGGTPAIPGQDGLFGKIEGELSYDVAIGTSAADAVAKVKEGITVKYVNAASTPSSNTEGTVYGDDDPGMKWTIDPSYDGVTPGEYAVTIAYNDGTKDTVLGVAKVVVPAQPTVAITGYAVEPMSANVLQGSSQTVKTGSQIIVNLEDGTFYKVPVTIGMLSLNGQPVSTADIGTMEGLTVTYNGIAITNNYTLNVVEKVQNHYPEYPNEGAVKVNKTATGVDFQSTGVSQVELSASGVPAQKGADVVVVIDTSSSMDATVAGSSQSRIEVLSDSLEKMLTTFQTPLDNGYVPDVEIAIIDFNGYLRGSEETFDQISLVSDNHRTNTDLGKIHTRRNANGEFTATNISDTTLLASDFAAASDLDAAEIAADFGLNTLQSGTNYDIALQNAYDLLAAKKEANGDAVRAQYVIFMSDGAPFRYNGFNNGSSQHYNLWNQWLSGEWADADAIRADGYDVDYLELYNGNGDTHPHRYAEAIKGALGTTYMVPHRDAASNNYQKAVDCLGAKIYAIGFGLAADTHGSGTSREAITVATMEKLIRAISSGDQYSYPNVQTAAELDAAFNHITTAIAYAATEARFVDQLGDNFNLQFAPITDASGDPYLVNGQQLLPSVEIKAYDIYTRAEHLANPTAVPENMIGVRKGTYTTLETVTFETDSTGKLTAAYSDQIYTLNGSEKIYTNILLDNGVIDAKYFLYNTGNVAVTVEGINIPTAGGASTELPSETFYWKMGTVQTQELAMSYYVYLTGTMDGTRPAGAYGTNNYAILYYTNYLGKVDCSQGTTSPSMAWKSANVSYAFYLVNEQGQIIVNQTTGETGSFANRIAVTNPVVYNEVYLNAIENIQALNVQAISEDVLPSYYDLYDPSAVYEVNIRSNSTGYWSIQHSKPVQSTYVTQFDLKDHAAFSNAVSNDSADTDYTHTVVWFAIVWKVQAHPDAVVVDYGLPVDISVLNNDMFGDLGMLDAVGAYDQQLETLTGDSALPQGFGSSFSGTYGTATVNKDTGKLRYTPNTMAMDSIDRFTYAVRYQGTVNGGYYYDHVTVIPATSVYYEETFLQLDSSSAPWQDTTANYDASGYTQSEDRPGKYSLSDANDLYGYDANFSRTATFSLGNAKKVHVSEGTYARASFSFIGTGFDVIGMTSNRTGVLAVLVEDAEGNKVEARVVDTYYGYIYEERDVIYELRLDDSGNRVWVKAKILDTAGASLTELPDPNAENLNLNDTVTVRQLVWAATPDQDSALYQVPVLTSKGLAYGSYKVTITATYAKVLDRTGTGGYDLYLDAIRVYDPAGTSYGEDDSLGDLIHSDIQHAYQADGEAWPVYYNIRELLLGTGSFNAGTDANGIVFIDGRPEVGNDTISDYESYGPNNEVYLAPGQSIAFRLTDTTDTVEGVHIALHSADGKKVTFCAANIASGDIADSGVKAGDWYHVVETEYATTTDMYYDLTAWKNDIIVLSNTGNVGDGILSLTNIKVTHSEAPTQALRFRMNNTTAALTVQALNRNKPVEDSTVGSPIVTEGPAIFRQPDSITVTSGSIARFHVIANGAPVSYQWQYRRLHTWFDTSMEGCNSDTLSVDAIGSRNGYSYRCLITYADGTVLISEPAMLRVAANMVITQQPKDQVVAIGHKAQFSTEATGEAVKYQWQYCRPGTDKWMDTSMEGATKATVLIETTAARDGYLYRCRITDAMGNTSYTEAATLHVLQVSRQPADVIAAAGQSAQFTVAANVSEGVTYRWQYSRNGETWYDTTMSGYNTDTLTVSVTAARNGYQYRCIVTGSKSSSVISDAAVLQVTVEDLAKEEAGA